ncbi:MAG: hypothetical protein CLLPBCKN_002796 [Chroococcidiopsis cubana SAG 39.79]|uniref:hypothetical protein n=1 Tax=Chroococcidiopsis cubana TaxID=171392 RepID=UPI002AC592BC|nr:hypothetical protein [Chroococcidiopsis cubana]MDZ4873400.1 hypothetical protein [Chroococcidiopsis cubana SAG 39.79]
MLSFAVNIYQGAGDKGEKGNSLFPRPKGVGIRGEGDKGDKGAVNHQPSTIVYNWNCRVD